jgi:hypothetical protein
VSKHYEPFQVRRCTRVAAFTTVAADTVDDVEVSLSDVDAAGVAVDDADPFARECGGGWC